jgi:hypothetical protein
MSYYRTPHFYHIPFRTSEKIRRRCTMLTNVTRIIPGFWLGCRAVNKFVHKANDIRQNPAGKAPYTSLLSLGLELEVWLHRSIDRDVLRKYREKRKIRSRMRTLLVDRLCSQSRAGNLDSSVALWRCEDNAIAS